MKRIIYKDLEKHIFESTNVFLTSYYLEGFNYYLQREFFEKTFKKFMIQIIRSLDDILNEDGVLEGVLEGDLDNYFLFSNNDHNIPWQVYIKHVRILTEIYKGLK